MTSKAKYSKPFPLEESLRDLALLRASEIDVSSLLPPAKSPDMGIPASQSAVEVSLKDSFELVREARLALKIHNRNEVESQGGRVEEVRTKLDELLSGIQPTN
jgi:hypothetical protein